MIIGRANLRLIVPLLLAAGALPLQAQYQPKGCPQGPQGTLIDAFTAGTPGVSSLCLLGSFTFGVPYHVVLTTSLATFTQDVQAVTGGLVISVPASFVTTGTGTDPLPVAINVTGGSPQGTGPGTFAINPPLTGPPPVFISAVGQPITAPLFSGGTGPFNSSLQSGQGPPGMDPFPPASSLWTGTPTQAGTYFVTVTAADAWDNGVSSSFAFYVVPQSAVISLTPNTALAGTGNTTLTITGSGYVSPATVNKTAVPGSVVSWTPPNSPAVTLTPTTITANQLTVTVPANLLATTGFNSVQVVNPRTYTSNAQPFSVTPSVTGLSVNTRTAGSSAFLLTVVGTGYLNGATVRMNGSPIPTNFVDGAHLTATFPTVNTPGLVTITVLNPDDTVSPPSTAGLINIVPHPVLTAINPTSANQGSPAFQLTVTGTNFSSGNTVFFNSSPVATAFVNANQLTALIPAAALVSAGTVPVVVANTDGYTTQEQSFSIISTVPPLQFSTLAPLPAGVVNTAYSLKVAATGGTGPYTFALIGGSLPAGLKFGSDGLLSGTPTTTGASRFTLQVTDATPTTVSRDYTLNISAAPLTLTTGPLSNVLQNAPVGVQFAGSGGVPPYSFVEFGALPPGTQFSSAGLLSGSPTAAGSFPFLVFINDSTGASASQKYTLNVALPGLLITPPSPLPPGVLATPYTTSLSATGGQGAPYTWSATGLPQGLTIADNTGLIAGIPRETGTFTVAVTVGDISGRTATQNYTLVIASSKLTISTTSLSNGAVGSSYSAAVQASGGTGAVTFTATGLPGGVTLSPSGTFSGTPTAAGTFTVAVTATDAQGQTATAPFTVIIANKLVITAATINAVLGAPLTPVKLTATGGTPPYQWQAPNPAPGLTLAADGTLSGTPTAQGNLSFPVLVVDSNGALSSGTVQVNVALPAGPVLTITGLPATNLPATQPRVQVALANSYPLATTAKLTLAFVPDSGSDDPSVQFAGGGRTAQITIPAGTTSGLTDIGLQTGTVVGTINLTAQLLAGTTDVTPSPAPTRSARVAPSAPVITAVTATRSSTGITVVVAGFSNTREVSTATYQFSGNALANLLTGQLTVPVGPLFSQWFGSAASAPFGGQFSMTQPFSVAGNTASVLSVTVTLTNTAGTSAPFTANLQ